MRRLFLLPFAGLDSFVARSLHSRFPSSLDSSFARSSDFDKTNLSSEDSGRAIQARERPTMRFDRE